MNYLILTLLLFANTPELISYRTLTWEDFRGPANDDKTAESTTEIRLEPFIKNNLIYFKAKAYFLPDSSFTTTGRLDVLDHENLHFTITFLYSLELQEAIEKYQGTDMKGFEKVKRIYNRYEDSLEYCQELFDKDTNNGNYEAVELRWEKNIYHDLNKLQ